MIRISASGVVSIAFAKTGLVLLCTITSLLNDIETIRMQPILAFRTSLQHMHVHRLILLIRKEREPPTLGQRVHQSNPFFGPFFAVLSATVYR